MRKLAHWIWGLSKTKKALIVGLLALVLFVTRYITSAKSTAPAYQTATVEKSNLIVSISVSGQVSSANSAEVTTQASGVVKTVYVKDGDTVKSGQKIADIDLDLIGQQRAKQSYASYLSAQNNVETAKANLFTSQSTMLTEWESYMSKAQNSTYENSDDSPNTSNRQLSDFVITRDDWLSAEAKYKVQEKTIVQAQTALSSAWYSYQQTSPTIVAPISGTITGLSLQPGNVITAQTNSSGGSSSQRIASVKTDAPPTVSLNITQIDAPKVKAGNKATLTFDAFPDKTFTGEVVSIDTIGSESSGVTTYPAI
ncbi:MAG TPA: efflux RND transporter periplasmic adaptor subunit, partial [Patescibacteria group bacterium]|nr:efflux RND transporter periplasmic adaptor subunit [Patescibacteria group bacterium]